MYRKCENQYLAMLTPLKSLQLHKYQWRNRKSVELEGQELMTLLSKCMLIVNEPIIRV